MGMLQLAGMVSGFGKGVGQGLQQMQSTMSNMQLLQIRDEMERARNKETWGHDEGMLQKRLDGETGMMRERAGLEHTNRLSEMGQSHTNELGQIEARGVHDLKKQKDAERFASNQDAIKREDERTKEGRDRRYKLEDEERKTKAELSKEGRDATRRTKERQEETGKDIVLETIRGQNRVQSGSAASKLDATTGAQLKVFTDRIGRLEDEANNVMTTKERRTAIHKEIAALEGKQNALLGIPSTQRDRPHYKFPD